MEVVLPSHPDPKIDALVQNAYHHLPELQQALEAGFKPDNFPTEQGEPIYRIVQHLESTGYSKHAAPLALQLAFHHSHESRYVYTAASIFQQLEQFKIAILLYIQSMAQVQTPPALFGIGQCMAGLKQTTLAIRAFEEAFDLARGQEQYRFVQDHAENAIRELSSASNQ